MRHKVNANFTYLWWLATPSDHLPGGNPNPIMRKPNPINDLTTLQVTSTLYYEIECDNCKSILANYSMFRNGGSL